MYLYTIYYKKTKGPRGLYMVFLRILTILLSFFPLFIYGEKNRCYALISYGYGDSALNAKNSFVGLSPLKDLSFICCIPFTKDSLLRSIIKETSYTADLNRNNKNVIKDNNFVILGHSRGAEMALHYVGEYNPKKLQAMVLFATPVSVGQVIKNKFFGQPQKVSKKTQKSISKIKNKSLPIILFHQKNDNVVTHQHSKLIYEFLKKQGFTNVYLVTLNTGNHNDLIDAHGYQVLQSFYKYYNLAHEEKYATLTQKKLLKYKP